MQNPPPDVCELVDQSSDTPFNNVILFVAPSVIY